MAVGHLHLLLLTVTALAATVQSQTQIGPCSRNCDCQQIDSPRGAVVDVQCEDVHGRFPQAIPSNVTRLSVYCLVSRDHVGQPIVEEGSIVTFEIGQFQKFPKLVEFHSDNCPLTKLEPNTFANLKSLEAVSLSSTFLETLPDSIFGGSRNLSSFTLIGAPKFQFNGLRLFQNLPYLRSLHFRTVGMSGVQMKMMLQPLKKSLRVLLWKHNQREVTLPLKTFEGFKLHTVNLASNRLTDFRFVNYTTAKVLTLKDNLQQTPFNLADFRVIKRVRILDLTYTSQYTVPRSLSKLPNLRTLILKQNYIKTLSSGDFRDVNNLESLDLGDNQIQVIPPELGPVFDRVIEKDRGGVRLTGNPFHCNCELRWMVNPKRMSYLKKKMLDGLQCAGPRRMRGKRLLRLLPDDLVCEMVKTPVIRWSVSGPGYKLVKQIEHTNTPTVYLRSGETARLRCQSSGDPAPMLTWHMPNGSKLGKTPDEDRNMRDTTFEIIVHQSEMKSNQVFYSCEATSVPLSHSVSSRILVINSDTNSHGKGKPTGKPGSQNQKGGISKSISTSASAIAPSLTTVLFAMCAYIVVAVVS